MSIILILGNVGSGKSASVVREMVNNDAGLTWYSNIHPKKSKETPWIIKIKPSMIVKKELDRIVKRKGTKKEEPIYKFEFNKGFWKDDVVRPCSVVLDEVHTLMNPRRSMSKINTIMTDFLAMLRRVIGEDPLTEGDLILITQLGRRAEVVAREMAHQVKYCVCHYTKSCTCGVSWMENSELPEKLKICPACGNNRLLKHSHTIEVFCFAGYSAFTGWKDWGMNTFYSRYLIEDIEDYFGYYDTLQWEDMFSELY